MPEQPDLVTTLVDAAAVVIRNQKPALRHDPATLRSVTVELNIDRRGQVTEADCWVARRVSVDTALGLRRRRP